MAFRLSDGFKCLSHIDHDSDDEYIPERNATKQNEKKARINKVNVDTGSTALANTSVSSVAGKEISKMSENMRETVSKKKLNKRIKTVANQEVKAIVLAENYAALLRDEAIKYLRAQVAQPATMLHARRPTVFEEQGTLNKIKIGDWVQVSVSVVVRGD